MRTFERFNSLESDSEMSDEEVGTLDSLFREYVRKGQCTTGVYDCAHILETSADDVLLCILPSADGGDISTLIQHKLIEAYCWENDIRVIKMESAMAVFEALKPTRAKVADVSDCNCVLIHNCRDVSSEQADDSVPEWEKGAS